MLIYVVYDVHMTNSAPPLWSHVVVYQTPRSNKVLRETAIEGNNQVLGVPM